MKYLLKTVETYRLASENEAKELIEKSKTNKNYSLIKYQTEYKEQKSKGDVVDSWYRVTLTKLFNEEKAPESFVDVNYNSNIASFPRFEEDEE